MKPVKLSASILASNFMQLRNESTKNAREFYLSQQHAITDFTQKVHSAAVCNEKGERFTTVVQIGIGGSDLGPRAVYLALEEWAKAHGTLKMNAHFISNVDPDDTSREIGRAHV